MHSIGMIFHLYALNDYMQAGLWLMNGQQKNHIKDVKKLECKQLKLFEWQNSKYAEVFDFLRIDLRIGTPKTNFRSSISCIYKILQHSNSFVSVLVQSLLVGSPTPLTIRFYEPVLV